MENKFKKILILLRGLPGSGKTILAETLLNLHGLQGAVYSADDYFVDKITGEYKFERDRIFEAHKYCQKKVEVDMVLGMTRENNVIIVANTFTRDWEMEPYLHLAKVYNYSVFRVIVEGSNQNENVHGVPKEVIENMKSVFEIEL